jgi:hypothetical protein
LRTVSGALSAKNSTVIAPALVSMTALCRPRSAGVSDEKGSGSGGGASRIVTERIAMRSSGIPRSSAGASEIFCTTSMPSATRPKIVY